MIPSFRILACMLAIFSPHQSLLVCPRTVVVVVVAAARRRTISQIITRMKRAGGNPLPDTCRGRVEVASLPPTYGLVGDNNEEVRLEEYCEIMVNYYGNRTVYATGQIEEGFAPAIFPFVSHSWRVPMEMTANDGLGGGHSSLPSTTPKANCRGAVSLKELANCQLFLGEGYLMERNGHKVGDWFVSNAITSDCLLLTNENKLPKAIPKEITMKLCGLPSSPVSANVIQEYLKEQGHSHPPTNTTLGHLCQVFADATVVIESIDMHQGPLLEYSVKPLLSLAQRLVFHEYDQPL